MKNIAFIFPGQGAQYVGMGKDLYDVCPPAREVFDKANEALGFDLTKLCFEGPSESLSSTVISQPAVLTMSIACLKTLESRFSGLKAQAALGLSLGEYSALVAAGSLDFVDGVRLVHLRGRFMEEASKQNPGKMLSIVGLDLEAVEEVSRIGGAEIANLNCPGQIVISGRDKAVEKSIALAGEKGAKRCVILDVSGPFHSSLMNEASVRLKEVLGGIKFAPPSVPVISNVTARSEDSEDEIKENLVNQVNQTTRWEDSIREITKKGVDSFLEIGPGRVLKGLLRRIDSSLTVYNAGTLKEIEELESVFIER